MSLDCSDSVCTCLALRKLLVKVCEPAVTVCELAVTMFEYKADVCALSLKVDKMCSGHV